MKDKGLGDSEAYNYYIGGIVYMYQLIFDRYINSNTLSLVNL